MASLFTHVAVPLVARRALDVPKELARRLDVIAVLVSIWPDLDYATLPFEVRPNELLGHRGVTLAIYAAAWLVVLVVLRVTMPFDFRPTVPRVVRAGDMSEIPTDKKLVTSLGELRALGLLDKTLEPKEKTWSSTFFPTWFGGDAG